MNKAYTSISIAARIWAFTSLVFGLVWLGYCLFIGYFGMALFFLPAMIAAAVLSLPVLIILCFVIPAISKYSHASDNAIYWLILSCFCGTASYGVVGGFAELFFYNNGNDNCNAFSQMPDYVQVYFLDAHL